MRRLSIVLTVIAIVALASFSFGQDFSVDPLSPEVPAPFSSADGVFWTGLPSPLVFTSNSIGLTSVDDIDAFSYGLDQLVPVGDNAWARIFYSADRPSVGLPGGVINTQAIGNGAAGDKFYLTISGAGTIITAPALWSDAPRHLLSTLPGQSDIDGLSLPSPGAPAPVYTGSAVYFSIDPATIPSASAAWGFPANTADIYIVPPPVGGSPPPVIPGLFVSAATLGLIAGDDIDAMAILDGGAVMSFDGADIIWVSLTAGSPTLAAIGATAADIIQVAPGPPTVVLPAAGLDLLAGDNLNALTVLDPDSLPVECESDPNIDQDPFGSIDIADLTAMVGFLAGLDPATQPYYKFDLDANCMLDSLDFSTLWSSLFLPPNTPVVPLPTCCNTSCMADFDINYDGNIDAADMTRLANFLSTGNQRPFPLFRADLDGNCVVDAADLQAMSDCLFLGGNCDPVPSCCEVTAVLDTCVADFDINNDATIDLADISYLIDFLWFGGPAPVPLYSADLNGDCVIDTLDIIPLQECLFTTFICDPVPTCCSVAVNFPNVECYADLDINNDGNVNVNDVTFFVGFLFSGGSAPSPLYSADLDGNCIIDTFDIAILNDCLFSGGPCPDSILTCCSVTVATMFDDVSGTSAGGAALDYVPETGVLTVSNIGSSGEDGVSIVAPVGGSIQRYTADLGNVDMSIDGVSISIDLYASPPGLVTDALMPPTVVGAVAITSIGGAMQVFADFSSLGDPNVTMKVYQSGILTGKAELFGGGVVAIGVPGVGGLPNVTNVFMTSLGDPGFVIQMEGIVEWQLINGSTLFGDEIHLLAANATGNISGYTTIDVKGANLGFFTMSNIDLSGSDPLSCCFGFRGNADNDFADIIDIGDITALVDYLFITYALPACWDEADADAVDGVDIGDLTRLIDFLFISHAVPVLCP